MNRSYTHIILVAAIVLLVLIVSACASMSPLTGGEKDVNAPVITSMNPPINSTGFSSDRIIVEFDEFIQLKSLQQKLIISPPLENPPEVIVKGKSLVIKFPEPLEANTTYCLNFSDAVEDFNEGNAIADFRIAFSTGTQIDSLQTSGYILESTTLKPSSGLFVMLYKNHSDSVPLLEKPYYITRTDALGRFRLANIKAGTYKIFALNDGNSNYLLDMPDEKIAFLSELVVPEVKTTEYTDTITKDSLVTRTRIRYIPDTLVMYSFVEDRQKQFVKSKSRREPWLCEIILNRPAFSDTQIKFAGNVDFISDHSSKGDTLRIWINDSVAWKRDTLFALIKYEVRDSAFNSSFTQDTVPLVFQKGTKVVDVSFVSFGATGGGSVDHRAPLLIKTNTPITMADPGRIILEELHDSTSTIIPVDFRTDNLKPRRHYLSQQLKPSAHYTLTLLPGSIQGMYGKENDTTKLDFYTYAVNYYGTLIIVTEKPDPDLVYQLLDSKSEVVYSWKNETAVKKRIENLPPGKYKLKAIYDLNRNGKADPGIYLQNLQPEKIILRDEEIQVRSNWDLEVKWTL
jgi:hypothetical protein